MTHGEHLNLCQACNRFHRTSREDDPKEPFYYYYPSSCPVALHRDRERDLNSCLDFLGNDYYLAFRHVQLVMRRHFLGPPNGIPLQAVEMTRVDSVQPGVELRQTWTPKIIRNELFLKASYHFSPARLEENIHPLIDSFVLVICVHHHTLKLRQYSFGRLPELEFYDLLQKGSTRTHGLVAENACARC